MATVAGIVALGIRNGLEKAATVMVPTVVVLLVGLAGYGATLDGAGAAYSYYLAPDLTTIVGDAVSILPAAAGQAFYTLSLGMGIMITYASYIGEDRNLLQDVGVIVVLDTAIALLAGLVVFPFLFTQGIEPGEGGAGSIFISLAGAFQQLPGGEILGGVFFLMLLVAALTSAFSIFEVVVSYVTDTFDVDRVPTAIGMAAVLFVVGIPTAIDLTYLDAYDLFANNILLILSGLLLSIFIGWVYAGEAIEELGKGRTSDGRIEAVWLTTLRYIVPIVLAITLALSVRDYIGFLQESFL